MFASKVSVFFCEASLFFCEAGVFFCEASVFFSEASVFARKAHILRLLILQEDAQTRLVCLRMLMRQTKRRCGARVVSCQCRISRLQRSEARYAALKLRFQVMILPVQPVLGILELFLPGEKTLLFAKCPRQRGLDGLVAPLPGHTRAKRRFRRYPECRGKASGLVHDSGKLGHAEGFGKFDIAYYLGPVGMRSQPPSLAEALQPGLARCRQVTAREQNPAQAHGGCGGFCTQQRAEGKYIECEHLSVKILGPPQITCRVVQGCNGIGQRNLPA